MKNIVKIYFLLVFTVSFLFMPIALVFGQTAQSNCVITKIGAPDPATLPNLPQGCTQPGQHTPLDGLLSPPNLIPHQTRAGYYQLPPVSPDNSYDVYTCDNQLWGSKELIDVLYTVAKRWKQKYPGGYLYIGDLNASGHASHKWGRAVDLEATTNGTDMVADFTEKFGPYNRVATVELGKMFVDTNLVKHIWFNDVSVNSEVLKYASDTGRSKNMLMQPITGHDNHFHLDINLEPLLEPWEPSC
jgi:hypothetical protein